MPQPDRDQCFWPWDGDRARNDPGADAERKAAGQDSYHHASPRAHQVSGDDKIWEVNAEELQA
eukprot:CAMPEP_0170557622 /NCGR_PEP_ID=MMETSP0211-20121228/28522_1 /TAXON_ID=311385 /ORGANISM="Pseudokeronopsis sp., Strain OXSARD2" /LENGTH=62 /DNA_ID=CAMNT_0010868815 /DNA_START=245 /DNA_END=429 /DNA_ORIENTATION=-